MRTALLLLWVLPAAAQFESLSTTGNGSVLFFTTRLSQTGTDQPHHGKVFLVDSRGVRPLLVRERVEFPAGSIFPDAFTTNFYDLVGVSIAGDIGALAITGVRECFGMSGGLCVAPDESEVYNARGERILTAGGSTIVSRNGRWALIVQNNFGGSYMLSVADLQTGVTSPIDAAAFGPRTVGSYGVADDGTVIDPSYQGVFLLHRDGTKEQLSDNSGLQMAGAIDSGATTAAWVIDEALSVWRRGKGVAVLGERSADPVITADGALVLVRARVGDVYQCVIVRTEGSGSKQVTFEPEGIRTATVSGNGHVVWAVTIRGRLLKVDLFDGTTQEVIGPVPAFLGTPFQPSNEPGLDDYASSPGAPLSFQASVVPTDRFAVRVGELSAPILQVGTGTVTVQMPWEATAASPYTPYQIEIIPEQPSGWTSAASLRMYPADPRFTAVAHQEFEGAVDEAHPAHPGEIIHLYGTGFGPVSPPVPTGQPAPISPLSTTTALECTVEVDNTSSVPAQVLFSGLAPLTVGYYQVDLQLPVALAPGNHNVRCFLPATDPQRLTGAFAQVAVQ